MLRYTLSLITFIALFTAAPIWAKPNVKTGTVKSADGLEIQYEVRGKGKGKPALVFVHCWACSSEYWQEQVETFADQYKVVTLDLGGHGKSGKTREAWSILELADDVEAVVKALKLKKIILIGHSMGGPVVLEAAAKMKGTTQAVVLVDTVHNAEFELPPEMFNQIVTMFKNDYKGSMAQMVRGMIPANANPDIVNWVTERAQGADQEATLALMADFANMDLKQLLTDVDVPVRGINAEPRPPFQPATQVETNRKYADYDAVIIEGVGHFLQLENPTAFNEALQKTLDTLTQ